MSNKIIVSEPDGTVIKFNNFKEAAGYNKLMGRGPTQVGRKRQVTPEADNSVIVSSPETTVKTLVAEAFEALPPVLRPPPRQAPKSTTADFAKVALLQNGPLKVRPLTRKMLKLGWKTKAKTTEARVAAVSCAIGQYGRVVGITQDGRGKPYYLTTTRDTEASPAVTEKDMEDSSEEV